MPDHGHELDHTMHQLAQSLLIDMLIKAHELASAADQYIATPRLVGNHAGR